MNERKFMEMAIEKAREGVENGQVPFGACIVKDGKVVSCSGNSVWKEGDITAHAEINAIRDACKRMKSIDLTGCTIYSTCEPCPMCFSACSWARISRIVYGARIEDAKEFGFSEMQISNEEMKSMANVKVEIKGDFLRNECMEVFKQWSLRSDKKTY